MCGIVGFWSTKKSEVTSNALHAMAAAISHRGPDDSGIWIDNHFGLGLAHRRLAIVDLSPAGHQPMHSISRRHVIVFNGEIYNHLEIRASLSDHPWVGHSDTETLLAAIERFGLEDTLKRAVGMFAMAVWDRVSGTLTLVRDRLGEKPLYYGLSQGTLFFASELKAIKECKEFDAAIDRNALALLMRHNYIPAPHSIYKNIKKLLPGTTLSLNFPSLKRGEIPPPKPYWSVREVVERGRLNPFIGTDAEAVDHLESLLRQSISGQMLADVPVGAFLSGGVDSSVVVALMQGQSVRPVRTFTVGFREEHYDEAPHALAVARHLGTEHLELPVTACDAQQVIPLLPSLYDEPFADSSQIPTFLLAKMTRQHVTVGLSGDGGDELFAGYNRYVWAGQIWQRVGWMPAALRAAIAGVLTSLPPRGWNKAFSAMSHLLPRNWRHANPGDKLHKLAEVLAVRQPEEIYWALVSHWKRPSDLVMGAIEPATVLTDSSAWPETPDFQSRMMYLDQMTYLPDDILTKVDRASMSVSLEARAPMLDHRIIEFAWSVPLAFKIRNGQPKWILRQVLYRHVPRSLIERPKMGFGIPLDAWLRGPLKPWADSLLHEARLQREGYFDSEIVSEKWKEHLLGRRNWAYYLWDVLMFQAWKESQS